MTWYRLAALTPLACTDGAGPAGPEPAASGEPVSIISAPSKSWVRKRPMLVARANHVAVAVNGIVYVMGGEGGWSAVHAYDPATDSWSPRWGMLKGLTRSSAAAVDGKIYVAGGLDGVGHNSKTLQVYDPVADFWKSKADMPVTSIDGAAAGIGGKLYVYTWGNSTNGGWPLLHRYDPATNTWVKLARPSHNVSSPAAGVIAWKLYLAGGHTLNGASNHLDVFDPATNAWTAKQPMPTARFDAAAAVAYSGLLPQQRLYVIGGTCSAGSTTMLRTVEAYNPASDTWTTVAGLRRPRRGVAAATANGIIYALGGTSDGVLHSLNEAY
jgi:N-acetylneuraminic acid mutarotase